MTATSSNTNSATYALRRRLPDGKVGDVLFSLGLWAKAPYFATVLPIVEEMEPGYARVKAPLWFGIHNHIGTFHAIAACNLAEAAMGVLMETTTPDTHRWIPKGMQSQYLAKAKTGLTAHAELAEPIDFAEITEGRDVVVSIRILDKAGTEVVHCDITTWVTPK